MTVLDDHLWLPVTDEDWIETCVVVPDYSTKSRWRALSSATEESGALLMEFRAHRGIARVHYRSQKCAETGCWCSDWAQNIGDEAGIQWRPKKRGEPIPEGAMPCWIIS